MATGSDASDLFPGQFSQCEKSVLRRAGSQHLRPASCLLTLAPHSEMGRRMDKKVKLVG